MVAIGVNDDGYREVIGAAEGFTESSEFWREFLSWLRFRGLRGVRMITGDKTAGMAGSIAEVFPEVAYQRCTAHFYRSALAKVPKKKRAEVTAMPEAIHAMESREAAEAKALEAVSKLDAMKLGGRPRRSSAKATRRPWPTRGSRASTGGAYALTTPSSGSTARYAGAPASWGRSPTETPSLCSSPPGSSTSRRASGALAATWT